MKTILQSLRTLLVLTVLTGVLYPLIVTAAAKLLFAKQANGSLVLRDGQTIGSALLAQKTESPRYFRPRPSAADFVTVASGASNQGPTSAALAKTIGERRAKFGADAPDDLLTTSGSGLDPHISPNAAHVQVARVAAARSLSNEKVAALIEAHTELPQLGFLGEPRVNVLTLNLALDALK